MTASAHRSDDVPGLCAGDRLTREEFHRRYEAMPDVRKAELVEGVVCMPSPVSYGGHGRPHLLLVSWIGRYVSHTPGVEGADNATILLDQDNELQPDALLRISSSCGGQSRVVGDYIESAPELVAEVAGSSMSRDLHDKLNAYRRNGVREYVVWRTQDAAVDWFALRRGRYEPLPSDDRGIVRSQVFPGFWLATRALVELDAATVRVVLDRGVATPEHRAFVERLRSAG